MDIYEAIEKRRTVRVFKGPVPEELLRKIMLAGSRAPSGMNRQPWEFIWLKDEAVIDRIAEQKYQFHVKLGAPEAAAARQRAAYKNASVVAICYKNGDVNDIAGTWMAALNMQLAATAEGFGCVTSTIGGDSKKEAEKILGLPQGYELVTVLVVGVPVSVPQVRERGGGRPDFSWLHVNKFAASA